MTASARPQRLLNLAETTGAIADALTTRAGWIEDDWVTYTLRNGVDWRFDAGDLPGALRAWAETLRAIGEFTGGVGGAFLVADSGDADAYHELSEGRLRDLMPCDMRVRLDESTATDEVDWGDPDDPPAWLDALDYSAMVVGHAGSAVDAWDVAYVVGSGAAAEWAPETPAVLGRFATPAQLAKFATLFSVGSAGLAGLAAGAGRRRLAQLRRRRDRGPSHGPRGRHGRRCTPVQHHGDRGRQHRVWPGRARLCRGHHHRHRLGGFCGHGPDSRRGGR
jgi:hypothetical protein